MIGLIIYLCVRDKTKKGSGKYKNLLIASVVVHILGIMLSIGNFLIFVFSNI